MLTLAHELKSQGHIIEFATFRGRGLGATVAELGYPVHEIPVRAKIDPLAIITLSKLLRTGQFDLIHSHLSTSAINGGIAARMAHVPGIATVHGMSGRLSFITNHHLIAVSSEVREHLVTQGVHESKITVVPNGIDLKEAELHSRRLAREKLGIAPEVPLIGTTARLTPLKGLDQSLAAFQLVLQDFPSCRYVIFGDGEQARELQDVARQLGISEKVMWMGYRTDVMDLLPALDVFVFPSLREAMGISVVEAMAAGIPTVANRIGGIPGVLSDGTGILVTASDPVEMADGILNLLRKDDLRKTMGEKAKERARLEFSVQRMATRTLAVYFARIRAAQRT